MAMTHAYIYGKSICMMNRQNYFIFILDISVNDKL